MPEDTCNNCSETQPDKKGLVSIFTGDGKGKTTAAIGTAVRAAGYGLRVFIVFFAKGGNYPCGEANTLSELPNITVTSCHHKNWIDKNNVKAEDKKLAESALTEAREAMLNNNYDLMILDEINIAINYGLIGLDEVISFVKGKPQNLELILTGRYAEPKLVEMADMVIEMSIIKHPYGKGIKARRGIDY